MMKNLKESKKRGNWAWGIICLLSLFFFSNELAATHNRAGEITYRQVGPLTFEITVRTYTKASSIPADRDSLEVCWGDGTCNQVRRTNGNGNGVVLANDIKRNEYVMFHTYPGRATYTVSMTDPNRNGNILNVNPPNSDQVPFHLETTLVIVNPQFFGDNTSPILTQAPIDIGYVNQPFYHNPSAYDVEGDSIAYELTAPLQGIGTAVSNYSFPNAIGTQPQFFELNEVTGTVTWLTPQKAGEYNFAMLVKEYRRGVLIGVLLRDMQITIRENVNRPPFFTLVQNICVVAGDTVRFQLEANDPDAGQQIKVEATGGPVLPASQFFAPGQLNIASGYQNPVLKGQFVWGTKCEHVQERPYQLVFRVEDDFEDTIGASSYLVIQIQVVGPPPQDVAATVVSGSVELSWEAPFVCEDAALFRGFSVWRRESSNPFAPDTCETGLAGRGYVKIADNWTTTANGRFLYLDNNVERGRFYCYRVMGKFAELTVAGFAYNFIDGIPSEEVCVQMSRDLPLITNVSIEKTDAAAGEVFVQWSRPLAPDLDTLQNPPPYIYRVYRALGGTNTYQLAASFTAPSFWQATDTFFTDPNRATAQNAYRYKIAMITNGGADSLGVTAAATSIFLTVQSTDRANRLLWNVAVPWENYEYVVYRFNNTTGLFDSIATTALAEYTDTGLENEREYCYYIKSIGTYNIPNVLSPLVNFSQEACGTPLDTVPPCPPSLSVANLCTDAALTLNIFENLLRWTNPNSTCADDVSFYTIFYAERPDAPFEVLATNVRDADDTTFLHQLTATVAGCYAVTATDSLANQSAWSNVVCMDNCPSYQLPNVFTPNGDNTNELFVPYPYLFVERVNLKVFNRWGGLVFQTEDADINWDGKDFNGNVLADGVYFYTCEVFEIRAEGVVRSAEVLKGYIHLIRSSRP